MFKSITQNAVIFFLLLVSGSCMESQRESLKFAFLTDIHVAPGSTSEENFSNVIDEINGSVADLVIITGDLSNTGSDAELYAVKSILDSLSKPYLIIPGNHETNWSESAGQRITEIWGDDRFIEEIGNYVLVGFNTGPYMKMGDGHVKQEDIQWLRTELAIRMKEGKKLVAFAHYPLADGLDNWFEVTSILKEYNCIATFCGHGHRLGLHNFDGIPGIMGRSLVLNDPTSPGYNIVEIGKDSVKVYEKLLGNPIGNPQIQFPHINPSEIAHLNISPLPDFSVNDSFPMVAESYVWTDTASIFSGISLVGDSMFIYGNSLGWVKAIDFVDNETEWETKFTGSIFSTPAATSDIVVFGSTDGSVYGLDVRSGEIAWQVSTGTPVLAAPIIIDKKVYIGGGSKAFYCINASSGETLWTFGEVDGLIQGKAAVAGDHLVFGAWDRHLYCLSALTGKLNWKWNNDRPHLLYSPGNVAPAISNNRVFIVAPDRFMTAINLKTGVQEWRTNKHQVRESMGISPDGEEVFAKLMNDSIVSISAVSKQFKTLWAVDAGIGYDHNPCPLIVSDKLVVGATKNGLITAINRNSIDAAWMHKSGNASVNEMLFAANGDIWFSTTEGRVVRLTFPKD